MAQRACDCFQRSLRQHVCAAKRGGGAGASGLTARRVELLEREVTDLKRANGTLAEALEAARAAAADERAAAAEERAASRKALGALSKVVFREMQELWAAVNGDSAAAAERAESVGRELASLRRSRDKAKERFASVARGLEEVDRQFAEAGARAAQQASRQERANGANKAALAELRRRLEGVLAESRQEVARGQREAGERAEGLAAAARDESAAGLAEVRARLEEVHRGAEGDLKALAEQVQQCEQAVENGALSVQQDMAVIQQTLESSSRKSIDVVKGLQRALRRQQVETHERGLLVDQAFAELCQSLRVRNPLQK